MTQLGEILKSQIEERKKQSAAIQAAKTAEELRQAHEDERSVVDFFNGVHQHIMQSIEENIPISNMRLPSDKPFYIQWNAANMSIAPNTVPSGFRHASPAQQFVDWCKANGLVCRFVANHDGVGVESWFEINIQPKV